MRLAALLPLTILAALLLAPVTGFAREDADDEEEDSSWAKTQIVVFGLSRSYEGTRENAMRVARESGIPFSDRGLVFDGEKGLRWPDDYEDDMWAGGYFQRRSNWCGRDAADGCISVELSERYDGLPAGYFVAVALVDGDAASVKSRLAELAPVAPDAYAVATRVYVGCLH